MGNTQETKDGGTYLLSPLTEKSNDLGDLYVENKRFDVRAEEGYALFFPSFLNHGSYPYKGAEQRIIFSSNAKVVGWSVIPVTVSSQSEDQNIQTFLLLFLVYSIRRDQ